VAITDVDAHRTCLQEPPEPPFYVMAEVVAERPMVRREACPARDVGRSKDGLRDRAVARCPGRCTEGGDSLSARVEWTDRNLVRAARKKCAGQSRGRCFVHCEQIKVGRVRVRRGAKDAVTPNHWQQSDDPTATADHEDMKRTTAERRPPGPCPTRMHKGRSAKRAGKLVPFFDYWFEPVSDLDRELPSHKSKIRFGSTRFEAREPLPSRLRKKAPRVKACSERAPALLEGDEAPHRVQPRVPTRGGRARV
jgi:hypothetical protein